LGVKWDHEDELRGEFCEFVTAPVCNAIAEGARLQIFWSSTFNRPDEGSSGSGLPAAAERAVKLNDRKRFALLSTDQIQLCGVQI
jgi:hypothetical protein